MKKQHYIPIYLITLAGCGEPFSVDYFPDTYSIQDSGIEAGDSGSDAINDRPVPSLRDKPQKHNVAPADDVQITTVNLPDVQEIDATADGSHITTDVSVDNKLIQIDSSSDVVMNDSSTSIDSSVLDVIHTVDATTDSIIVDVKSIDAQMDVLIDSSNICEYGLFSSITLEECKAVESVFFHDADCNNPVYVIYRNEKISNLSDCVGGVVTFPEVKEIVVPGAPSPIEIQCKSYPVFTVLPRVVSLPLFTIDRADFQCSSTSVRTDGDSMDLLVLD